MNSTGFVQSDEGHIFQVTIAHSACEIYGSAWKLVQAADAPVEGDNRKATAEEAAQDLDEEFKADAIEELMSPDSVGFYGFADDSEGLAWAEGRIKAAA